MKKITMIAAATWCLSGIAHAQTDTFRSATGWITLVSPKPRERFAPDANIRIVWACSGNLNLFSSHMIDQQGTWGRLGAESLDRNDSTTVWWQPMKIANKDRDEPVEIHITGYEYGKGSVDGFVKVVFPRIK